MHGRARRRQIFGTSGGGTFCRASRSTRVTRVVRVLQSIAQIDAASWNSLLRDGQPFLRHEFLLALEESGCAVPRTGWSARHLVIEDADGRAIGAMPLFRKGHSRGEFVFDFSWANAYA